ncbi:MAG TPA: hypothetical protein VKG45_03755 [Actinomycetes bacterium]|nr:hypothetical protein [Actinomycetes bacterium]
MEDGVGPSFALNASTLAVIGALLGALAGTISFLFRALVQAKEQHIATVIKELEQQRAVMMAEIAALKLDRDYFRDLALAGRGRGARAAPATPEPRRLDRGRG